MMAMIPTPPKKYSLKVAGLWLTGVLTGFFDFGAAPDSFVRVDSPVPGSPALRCVPFLLTLTDAPLPPIVALLIPLRPMLILTPGAIFNRLLKRNAIDNP